MEIHVENICMEIKRVETETYDGITYAIHMWWRSHMWKQKHMMMEMQMENTCMCRMFGADSCNVHEDDVKRNKMDFAYQQSIHEQD